MPLIIQYKYGVILNISLEVYINFWDPWKFELTKHWIKPLNIKLLKKFTALVGPLSYMTQPHCWDLYTLTLPNLTIKVFSSTLFDDFFCVELKERCDCLYEEKWMAKEMLFLWGGGNKFPGSNCPSCSQNSLRQNLENWVIFSHHDFLIMIHGHITISIAATL